MKKNIVSAQRSTLPIALWFFLGLLIVLTVSLIVKLFFTLSQSRFDGKHRFIMVFSSTKEKGRVILSVDPMVNTLSVLSVSSEIEENNLGKLLKIPIGGNITFTTEDIRLAKLTTIPDKEKESADLLIKSILYYKLVKTNLTPFDIFRLWWVVKNIPPSNVSSNVLVSPLNELVDDKIITSLLADTNISQENVSIQIINAAEIPGLGNRLARFISNMGGTVLSVTTAENSIKESQILYIGKKNYTVEKLSKLLNFPAISYANREASSALTPTPIQVQAVSDIIIIIGTEHAEDVPF